MRKLKLSELQRSSVEEHHQAEKIPVVIVLDNMRSGVNVGAFFRTADAFLIERVVLCGITCCPPHREILKTAIGATRTVVWEYAGQIDKALKKLASTHVLIGIEQTDESISLTDFEVDTSERYALVFGNEVEGLTDSCLPLLDLVIEIPQFGTKHSLNVAVCGGIVLWHVAQPFLIAKKHMP